MREQAVAGKQAMVYVGTYTGGESEGIYRYIFDYETGLLNKGVLVAKAENPSFLVVHPSKKWLYAVGELMSFEGEDGGAVSAFSIAPETGELLLLNQQRSMGGAPCHISVDETGKWVMIANYGGGNVASYPVEDGGLLGPAASFVQHEGSSVNQKRQQRPHAHSITPDPANQRAIAADLGTDQLISYNLNPDTGKLDPVATYSSINPGAGPRHFVFHPNGIHAFVINELDSTISSLRYTQETGVFEEIATVSTLPDDFAGTNSCADIHVSPDGRFVYGSNRGHDSIVIMAFDESNGALIQVGHESTRGKTPRNFTLDPTGNYLLAANQNSNSIFVFRVDQDTGLLKSTGQRIETPSPVCLKFA